MEKTESLRIVIPNDERVRNLIIIERLVRIIHEFKRLQNYRKIICLSASSRTKIKIRIVKVTSDEPP